MKSQSIWSSSVLTVLAALALTPGAQGQTPTLSTNTLNFSMPQGISCPASQSVTLTAPAGATTTPGSQGALDASGTGGGWLFIQNLGGVGAGFSGQINVSIGGNCSSLVQGNYSKTITYQAAGFTGSAVLTVNLQVIGSGPTLTASPATLAFGAVQGGANPAPQQIVTGISSGTAGPYTAAVLPGAAWLTITSGAAGTVGGTITAMATLGALTSAQSPLSGTIRITSAGAGNSPLDVPVTFTISPVGSTVLQAAPSSLTFNYTIGGVVPPVQLSNLTVSSGGGVYSVTPVYNTAVTGWLQALSSNSTASGNTPDNISVSVFPTSLAAGSYSANARVTYGGTPAAGNSPFDIPVTLNVLAANPTTVTANPATLTFFATPGGSAAAQPVSISTTGAAQTWTAVASQPWITLSATMGSTGTSLNIGVTAAPASNATGTVTLTNSVGPPTVINVSVNVNAAAQLVASPSAVNFSTPLGINPAAVGISLSPSIVGGITSAFVTATSSPTWLIVTPVNNIIIPNTLTVSANVAGLAAGPYSGSITITGAFPNSPVVIPVSLVVGAGGGGGSGGTLVVAPTTLNFQASPTTVSGQQFVHVDSNNGVATNFSVGIAYSSGTNWLSVSPTNATTPFDLTVSVPLATLPPLGTYSATVTLTTMVSGFPQTATFTVGLNVQTAAQLLSNPGSVSLLGTAGGTSVQQFVSLGTTNAGTPVTTFTATPSIITGSNWLTATPSGAAILVTLNPAGLTAGTYSGSINVVAAGFAANLTIPVTFTVSGPGGGGGGGTATLAASASPLVFFTNPGISPAGQTITISSSLGTIPFNAFASVISPAGGSWLSVGQSASTTPGSLTVSVNPAGLGIGLYQGTITVSSSSAANSLMIPVTLNVTSSQLLTASPSSLTFSFPVNTTTPQAQVVSVNVSSGAQVSFTPQASSAGNWLSVSTSFGTTPSALVITANPTGLTSGTYSGTLNIISGGIVNSPLSIPVSLTITGTGSAQLTSTPSSLIFYAQPGAVPPPNQNLTISTTGSALSYTATATAQSGGQSWLVIPSPQSGTTPSSFSVGVNPVGLGLGSYTGTVAIASGGATNSPLNVQVTLVVTNDPLLLTSNESLTFSFQTGQNAPVPRLTVVRTSTGTAVNFNATATTTTGTGWLTVTSGGTTPGGFVTTVNPAGLAPGTYTGNIAVAAAGLANSPKNIPVTLNVSGTPLLRVNPSSLQFNAQQFGNPPAPQTVAATSTGDPINVSVSAQATGGLSWLTATLNQTTTPATINVSANPLNLFTGTYTGTVTVTSSSAGNNPMMIPVTLTVATTPLLNLTPSALTFNATAGSSPVAQTIQVASTSNILTFAASSAIVTGTTNWLVVSPQAGSTPGSVSVSVNPAGLTDGNYFGIVTVTSPGIMNSPQTVPIQLTVSNTNALVVSPLLLTFTQVQGGTPPPAQTVQVNSGGPVFSYSTSVTTTTGGNWLTVSPTSGITPSAFQVSVNGASLSPGTYTGTIILTASGAGNSPLPITVILNVQSGVVLAASPAQVAFTSNAGGPNPASQSVAISSTGVSTAFTAMATSAGNWLTVSPATGSTPSSIQISANIAGLTAGSYSGTVTIGSGSSAPLSIPVTLTLSAAPPLQVAGVSNGASFLPTAVAPGQILSLFGTGLGPTQLAVFQLVNGMVPRELAGTRVLFDGIAAPILAAVNGQINLVVPYQLAGRISTRLQVERNGQLSSAVDLRVQETAPGLFSANSSGQGQAAVANQDGSLNSAANPAARGSFIVLYATGAGQTNPGGVDGGVPSAAPLPIPVAPITVRINGVAIPAANVAYNGAAPGFVSGLIQINVRITDDAPIGNAVPITVEYGAGINAVSSQGGLTIAIRQ